MKLNILLVINCAKCSLLETKSQKCRVKFGSSTLWESNPYLCVMFMYVYVCVRPALCVERVECVKGESKGSSYCQAY